jgi:hypothetical protein
VKSDSWAKTETPCAGKVINEQDRQMKSGANHNNPVHGVAPQPQPGICAVARASAAFHEAQGALVALTSGGDDAGSDGLSELRARRNETFEQVREMAALTRCAVHAKLRVLGVVGHWFGEDSPDVCAFAMDVAFEAAALLDSDPDQTCSCHHPRAEACVDQAGNPRRSPFAWFARPRRRTADTPFAS